MSNRARAEAADLLGLPALPPGRAAKPTAWVRGRLRRGAEAAPAFVVVLERMLSIYDPVVLRVLCQVGVPEALAAGPATLDALADRLDATRATPVDRPALHRIVRYAGARGFVAVDRRGRVRANGVTEVLRADHPGSARGWVDLLSAPGAWRILEQTSAALDGVPPCVAAHGTDFFTHANERDPALGDGFNRAMQQGSLVQGLLLADHPAIASARRLVDVGGGTGQLARTLLRHHPQLRVEVLDLPAVVEAGRTAAAATDDRCTWVPGDFFEAVPSGADVYTLLAIIHDWGDDDAVRILGNVRAAMAPAGRCLVVDALLDERRPDPLMAAIDVMMLAFTDAGRERTSADWEHVVERAGLRIDRTRPLPTGFTLFELVPA